MAWEDRNGKSYYYRKERDGDRVRSVYVGGGETARLIAQLDEIERAERIVEQQAEREWREEIESPDDKLGAFGAKVRDVAAATLIISGFHRHKREWRRKKMSDEPISDSEGMVRAKTIVARGDVEIFQKFIEAYRRADKKNAKPADLQALRDLLDENETSELWRIISGLTQTAESALLTNDNISPALKECWRRRMRALRAELGHKDAPKAEQLLIEHASLCWLRLNLLEAFAGQLLSESMTLPKAMFYEKRLEVAQRRFTRALESLAKVRTLTAATRLIESRTEAASAAKSVNSLRLMKALSA
jgi:hypothetical protein